MRQMPSPMLPMGIRFFAPLSFTTMLAGCSSAVPTGALSGTADAIRSIEGSIIFKASITRSSSGVSTISPKNEAAVSGVSDDDETN